MGRGDEAPLPQASLAGRGSSRRGEDAARPPTSDEARDGQRGDPGVPHGGGHQPEAPGEGVLGASFGLCDPQERFVWPSGTHRSSVATVLPRNPQMHDAPALHDLKP